MSRAEGPARAGRGVQKRYTAADLRVLTRDEARRFDPHGDGDPQTDLVLAWELLYRLEPELYDRLASAERLHPAVVGWLPRDVERIAEVGAGAGRLTLELIDRGREVVAVEPARPLRQILRRKLAARTTATGPGSIHGFFDRLPLPDDFADLVVACSAFTPDSGHGGEGAWPRWSGCAGRAAAWPSSGRTTSTGSPRAATGTPASRADVRGVRQLRRGHRVGRDILSGAADQVRRRGQRRVPFEVLGVNPPRDLAFKVLA